MLREFSEFPIPAEEVCPSEPLPVASLLPETHRYLMETPKDVHPSAVRTPSLVHREQEPSTLQQSKLKGVMSNLDRGRQPGRIRKNKGWQVVLRKKAQRSEHRQQRSLRFLALLTSVFEIQLSF